MIFRRSLIDIFRKLVLYLDKKNLNETLSKNFKIIVIFYLAYFFSFNYVKKKNYEILLLLKNNLKFCIDQKKNFFSSINILKY